MNITERLMQLDPTLIRHNEGHWDKPYDPNMPGFSSFNDAGIECETGEFMYAMVRMLKPAHVLETGTHHGVGASYMGMALKENNNGGILDTIEFIPEINNRAVQRIAALGLTDNVHTHFGDVAQFRSVNIFDLVLLDTEPITRFGELVKFYDQVAPGGFIFIHDAPRSLCQGNVNPDHPEMKSWPFGDIPDQMLNYIMEGNLRQFHFPTPRGLVGFYKTHPDDVKFHDLVNQRING